MNRTQTQTFHIYLVSSWLTQTQLWICKTRGAVECEGRQFEFIMISGKLQPFHLQTTQKSTHAAASSLVLNLTSWIESCWKNLNCF